MAKNLINEILDVIESAYADARDEHLKINMKIDRKRYRKYLEKLFIAEDTELRLKSDIVEIIWKDGKTTFEKADFVSFGDRTISIEYENETTIMPFKNIKKVKFSSSLSLKKKQQVDWIWNPNLNYYDDTSSIAVPSWYLNFTTK